MERKPVHDFLSSYHLEMARQLLTAELLTIHYSILLEVINLAMSAETRNFAEKFTTQMKTKYNIVIFLAVLLAMVSCGKSGEKSKGDRRAEAKKERARDAAAFKVAVTPTIDCLPCRRRT